MSLLKVRQRSSLSQVVYGSPSGHHPVELESQQPHSLEFLDSPSSSSSSPSSFCSSPSFLASSRSPSPSSSPSPSFSTSLWRLRLENLLWIASAAFIIYYGDFRSNLVTLLLTDTRIRRTPLNLGLVCAMVDLGIFIYLAFRMRTGKDRVEVITSGAIPAATALGLMAFMLNLLLVGLFGILKHKGITRLLYALWPVWHFLTFPMLFTLFMAFLVIAPYFVPSITAKFDADALRCLYIRSAE